MSAWLSRQPPAEDITNLLSSDNMSILGTEIGTLRFQLEDFTNLSKERNDVHVKALPHLDSPTVMQCAKTTSFVTSFSEVL